MVAATGGVARDMMTTVQMVTMTSNVTLSHATGSCRSTSNMSWENLLVMEPMSWNGAVSL